MFWKRGIRKVTRSFRENFFKRIEPNIIIARPR